MTSPSERLGDIAVEMRSGFACGEEDSGGIIQFRMNNVTRDGSIDWSKLRRVPSDVVRSEFEVRPGDILFNATNSPELVGKTALFVGYDEPVTFSNHFVRIRLNRLRAEPAYVARYIMYKWNMGAFEAMCRQWVNQASVSKTQLEDLQIPLPSLEEQRRTAEILDQADSLRRKRERSLQQMHYLRTAYFIEQFGAPFANPKAWPAMPFSELCENEDGFRVPVRSSDRAERGGKYPYYGASGIIDYVDNYLFDGERLLIGEDGANLLARSTPVAFIASGKYWVNNHAHVLAANGRAELRFLEYFINTIDLAPYVSGSAQPKLNQANLNRIPVPVPPVELQKKFVNFLNRVDRTIEKSRTAGSHFSSLFSMFQHRAFSGDL